MCQTIQSLFKVLGLHHALTLRLCGRVSDQAAANSHWTVFSLSVIFAPQHFDPCFSFSNIRVSSFKSLLLPMSWTPSLLDLNSAAAAPLSTTQGMSSPSGDVNTVKTDVLRKVSQTGADCTKNRCAITTSKQDSRTSEASLMPPEELLALLPYSTSTLLSLGSHIFCSITSLAAC